MTNLYPENDYRNYLKHHGILGMKWGIRRFQNYDGSLTTAGRERYGHREARENAEANMSRTDPISALKNGPVDGNVKDPKYVDTITMQCLPFDCAPHEYMSKEAIKKRANDAALTGLKALHRVDPYMIDYEESRNPTQGTKDWFVYEDQTIGLAMIADLVNQGYDKQTLSKLIDTVEQVGYISYKDERYNSRSKGAVFDLTEGNATGRLKSFANACVDIKIKEKLNDAKKNNQYELNFLETVQNDAVLNKGGKNLLNEYKKYLSDRYDYVTTFKESDYQKHYKNSPEVRKAMKIAKAEGWSALTARQKELLNDLTM